MPCLLATTKPGCESEAARNLIDQGYDVFLPMTRTEIVDSRKRTRARAAPLFPGYVFIWWTETWRSILSTRGVSGVVSMTRDESGDRIPSCIPDHVMNRVLGEVLSHTDIDGFVELPPAFSPGQTLRVSSGPWAGVEVVLRANDAMGRVRCLLKMLGREIERTFHERNLEAVAA